MKKVIIISMSFLLSLPMVAQKTVKSSSSLELIYKIDRKMYNNRSSKHFKKIREQIIEDIDKVFMADTIFIISREDIHESAFSELIWSKNDSIEYTFHYHDQIFHKDEGDFALDYILKRIKENKSLPNPLKVYEHNHEPIEVRKIIRQNFNVYSYFIYETYFEWSPEILLQYEIEQCNKATKK